jgi:ribosomal-protein-alanine N-acetyltransferase
MGTTIAGPAGCDAAVLAALHEACFDDGWSVGAMSRILDMPGVSARLAVSAEGDNPTGFVIWRVADDEAEIITIGVRPGDRGGGIGHRLVAAAENAAAAAGARRMVLEVAAGNAAGLALYHAAGYQRVGRRQAYYRDRAGAAEDAVVMARPLGT